jgi:hypothetical protein
MSKILLLELNTDEDKNAFYNFVRGKKESSSWFSSCGARGEKCHNAKLRDHPGKYNNDIQFWLDQHTKKTLPTKDKVENKTTTTNPVETKTTSNKSKESSRRDKQKLRLNIAEKKVQKTKKIEIPQRPQTPPPQSGHGERDRVVGFGGRKRIKTKKTKRSRRKRKAIKKRTRKRN